MQDIQKKLRVLSDIAHVLNEAHVTWAVGASALLYLKGRAKTFEDIDLMAAEEDAEKIKVLLSQMGKLLPEHPDARYQTRHFMEWIISGIDVDVMAGLVIVKDGQAHECPFGQAQIAEYIQLHGETIPLQFTSDWERYYTLMGRTSK